MIILITLILLAIGFCIGFFDNDYYHNVGAGIWFALLFAILPVCIMAFLICAYPYNIEQKIDMYVQENVAIETRVKSTVKDYMNYEKETYDKLVKTADLEVLLIKYPKLGANSLVKEEIKLYNKNNKKIKELKEKQIDKSVIGWWLFFNIGQ